MKISPCFRLFRLRQFDVGRKSCSSAVALKRQDHVTVNDDKIGSEYWLATNTCRIYTREKPLVAGFISKGKTNYYKSNRVEHQGVLRKSQEQQKLDFDQLLNQNCDHTIDKRNVSRRNATPWGKQNSKAVGASTGVCGPDPNIDFSQLAFLKHPSISQKDNLALKDSGISERVHQNVRDDQNRPKTSDKKDKPTYAQLQKVADYYENQLPAMHARGEDFTLRLHSDDIIFENHYTKIPASCQGLGQYRMALAKMRIVGNLCYPSFRFKVVSIRCDMDQGAVILHWKFFYITNIGFLTKAAPRVLLTWKKESAFEEDDAISTFYVNGEGKIIKHKVDNRVPLTGEKVKAEGILNRFRKKLTLANT